MPTIRVNAPPWAVTISPTRHLLTLHLTHYSVLTGSYTLRVIVTDNETPSASWRLDVPFKVRLP